MEDPFPIAPDGVLSKAIQPLADHLSLRALPLHIHEILIMATFCEFCYRVVSPMISAWLLQDRYARFSRDAKLSWNKEVIYWVKSIIIGVLSQLVVAVADGKKSVPAIWGRVYGYDDDRATIHALFTGYCLWEFILVFLTREKFRPLVRLHAALELLKSLFGFVS